MNKIKELVNQNKLLILLLILLSLLLNPSRPSFSNDDAGFAYFIHQILNSSNWTPFPSQLGSLWPQVWISTIIAKIFKSIEINQLLNLITWCVFCLFILFIKIKSKISVTLLLSFFSFPIWFQYAVSFMGDIYAFCILFLFYFYYENKKLSAAFSILATLQMQTLAAFSFFAGLVSYKKNKKIFFIFVLSSLVGVFILTLLPQSQFQEGYFYWKKELVKEDFNSYFIFVIQRTLQLFVSLGLYFIPFINIEKIKSKSTLFFVCSQILFTIIFFKFNIGVLSSGVLFTDYLPRIIGISFLSFGFWGLKGIYDLINKEDRILLAGIFISLLVINAFNAFRSVGDIRYTLTLTAPILFLVLKNLNNQKFIGNKTWYLLPVLVISIIVNRYNLDTTQIRWELAKKYESLGFAKNQISAGYGRDHFTLEADCSLKALAKVRSLESNGLKSELAIKKIMETTPRVYEDEWSPNILIKPSQFFGKKLELKNHRKQGQELEPIERCKYSVFGIPNEVSVINTGLNVKAWCDL